MKIFISWSGETSKKIATALRTWLPADIFPGLEPWMSATDIFPGDRWQVKVAKHLEQSNFGIICLTSDNLQAPWPLFEAGALSKTIEGTHVIPLLSNVSIGDIPQALQQFQAQRADQDGIERLVLTIGKATGDPRSEDQLKRAFRKWWPSLDKKLKAAVSAPIEPQIPPPDSERLTNVYQSIAEFLEQHPEPAYRYSANRLGGGYSYVYFECAIRKTGSAQVRRIVEVEAFSVIDSIEAMLLFPEAKEADKGIKTKWGTVTLNSRDSRTKVSKEKSNPEDYLVWHNIVFKPPLAPGQRAAYELIERPKATFFRLESDHLGWNVYRATRFLHMRVIFPKDASPDEYWATVKRSSSSGFPVQAMVKSELQRVNLHPPIMVQYDDNRYAVELKISYPVPQLIYSIEWKK